MRKTIITIDGPAASGKGRIAKYIAKKGSITLNGTSLTVNQVTDSSFDINFIPHTKDNTTWEKIRVGEKVNIEIDILARYVDRILGSGN